MVDLIRIQRKLEPTGKDLGRLALANYMYQYRHAQFPLPLEYAPERAQKLSQEEKDVYNKYAALLSWFSFENMEMGVVFLGARECLSNLIQFLSTSCSMENALLNVYKAGELTDGVGTSIRSAFSTNTLEALDPHSNIDSEAIRETLEETLHNAQKYYYGVNSFNTMIDLVSHRLSVEEMQWAKLNLDELKKCIEIYNDWNKKLSTALLTELPNDNGRAMRRRYFEEVFPPIQIDDLRIPDSTMTDVKHVMRGEGVFDGREIMSVLLDQFEEGRAPWENNL